MRPPRATHTADAGDRHLSLIGASLPHIFPHFYIFVWHGVWILYSFNDFLMHQGEVFE